MSDEETKSSAGVGRTPKIDAMARSADGTRPWLVVLVTALIAAVPPITAQVYGNISKAKETALAQQKEDQEMRMQFLDRAIDPKYPLESRLEVLRFLRSVSSDKQMTTWADEEIRSVKDELNLKKEVMTLRQDLSQKSKEVADLKAQSLALSKLPDKAEKAALERKLIAAKEAQKQAELKLANTSSHDNALSSPEEADNLSALANSYYKSGDYSRAEAALRRSIELQERKYGHNHPAVSDGLCNLGALYLAKGDPERAEALFREALEIRRDALGSADPGNAKILVALATVLEAKGKSEEARSFRMRADELYGRTR